LQIQRRAAIGERIRQVRGVLTQAEFAARLGVGRTSVVRYEAGQHPVDAEFLVRAYRAFGTDPLWLLTGSAGGAIPC